MNAVLRRLAADTRGFAPGNMLQLALNWFVIFSVFLMIIQLGLVSGQRDAIDHATAVANDIAMKTFCDKNAAKDAAETAVRGDLALVGPEDACTVEVTPAAIESVTAGVEGSGGKPLNVHVHCEFQCTIPLASKLLCDEGLIVLDQEVHTVALGCDGK